MTALTPKRLLTKMAEYLDRMEDAQRRFGEADRDYVDGVRGAGDRRNLAQSDTAYYSAQAQTYALAAIALLGGMDRYPLHVKQVDGPLREPLPAQEFLAVKS